MKTYILRYPKAVEPQNIWASTAPRPRPKRARNVARAVQPIAERRTDGGECGAARDSIGNRQNSIHRRLAPKNWEAQSRPMLKASNIHYEMAECVWAINGGGIVASPLLVQRLGLVVDLDRNLKLLKVHLPYHESNHVLNIAYNILAGGGRLEDIKQRRRDENFLNELAAQRLPDPTAVGDFTRRFKEADILALQECLKRFRQAVWRVQPAGFLKEAFIEVDGRIAGTAGVGDLNSWNPLP